MHVWNMLHAARWKYRTQKWPFWHHCTTLSSCIFAAEACIDNRKKLLNNNISSTCPHNMVNFGLLTAEICWASLRHPCEFQWLSRLGSVTPRHSSGARQPDVAALNRGRHYFGRATITLGIGPHSSFFINYSRICTELRFSTWLGW